MSSHDTKRVGPADGKKRSGRGAGRTAKPKLSYALRLRCPLCGVTPLREGRHFFIFRKGCPACDYCYDRGEEGYFQGAAWMVNYALLAFSLLAAAALLLMFTNFSAMQTVTSLSVVAVLAGALLQPYGRALWMWFDLKLNPLGKEETLT